MEKVKKYKSEVDSLIYELDYLESQLGSDIYFNYCGEEIELCELKERIITIEFEVSS